MTHEFGHHQQLVSGILGDVDRQRTATSHQPNGQQGFNELTRRVELQAECMAAASLSGSWSPFKLSQSDFDRYAQSHSTIPPDWAATHGSGGAQLAWINKAAKSTDPHTYAVCNTFTAPADQVD